MNAPVTFQTGMTDAGIYGTYGFYKDMPVIPFVNVYVAEDTIFVTATSVEYTFTFFRRRLARRQTTRAAGA